jgi:hypothetical protein
MPKLMHLQYFSRASNKLAKDVNLRSFIQFRMQDQRRLNIFVLRKIKRCNTIFNKTVFLVLQNFNYRL